MMILIIDLGNTNVKAAVFEKDTLLDIVVFEKGEILSEIKKILKKHPISKAVMSNVASISDVKQKKFKHLLRLFLFPLLQECLL